MPTASRTVRKNRRIKRNETIALRAMKEAFNYVNEARNVAAVLEKELQKRENAVISQKVFRDFFESRGLGEANADALYELITNPTVDETSNKVTITKVEDAG